jgi:hypothetical protein
MSDLTIRLVILAAVVLVVVVVSLLARRLGAPYHAALDLSGLDLPTGLVMFTSTACENCKKALEVAKATGAPLREITHEIEPGMFDKAGVAGVPLTIVIDANGTVVDQMGGIPQRRRLQRALARTRVTKP